MTLDDPPQLARLVGGELPGFPDERRLRDRRPSIDVLWKVLALKLSGVRWLTVCHGVPRSRQGDHDVATLHFDAKVVGGSPASREVMPPLSTVKQPEQYPDVVR